MSFTFDLSGDPLCLANIRACAAAASRLAYSRPTITETGESALLQDCGNARVIAFPGTHDLRDVLRDLDCVRVRATILGQPCSVHAGFARSHEALTPKIIAACITESFSTHPRTDVVTPSPWGEGRGEGDRDDRTPKSPSEIITSQSVPAFPPRSPLPLFLTGHSKGAAVAKRCALSLLERNIPVHAVITFGEPRGGDSRYAAIYRDVLGQRTLRVTNAADPVPWLPAWLAGNRHCGPEAWFPPNPQPSTCSTESILPVGGRLKQRATDRDKRPTLLPLPEGEGGVRGNTTSFCSQAHDVSCQPLSTLNPQLIYAPRLWWKFAQNFREIYHAWQIKQLTPLSDHHIDNYLRRLNAL